MKSSEILETIETGASEVATSLWGRVKAWFAKRSLKTKAGVVIIGSVVAFLLVAQVAKAAWGYVPRVTYDTTTKADLGTVVAENDALRTKSAVASKASEMLTMRVGIVEEKADELDGRVNAIESKLRAPNDPAPVAKVAPAARGKVSRVSSTAVRKAKPFDLLDYTTW